MFLLGWSRVSRSVHSVLAEFECHHATVWLSEWIKTTLDDNVATPFSLLSNALIYLRKIKWVHFVSVATGCWVRGLIILLQHGKNIHALCPPSSPLLQSQNNSHWQWRGMHQLIYLITNRSDLPKTFIFPFFLLYFVICFLVVTEYLF